MTTGIIIMLCVLLLIAYIFDVSAARTKIPSVILLLSLGWGVRQFTELIGLHIPGLFSALNILGTIGLILIVLEGSLELELDRSKLPVIGKSFIVALFPMLLLAFVSAFALYYFEHASFKNSLGNVIPICVISSAIAIPTARNLNKKEKEFIIYESSLSDILGVLFFNFIVLNASIGAGSVGHFILELVLITVISFVATAGLAFLLSKIDHHIKFAPIILLIILIYNLSKIYHLPGLIFILLFGIFLGNLEGLKHFNWIAKLRPEILEKEVHKFREITAEATFIIRALFFLLFGYTMDTAEILNTTTLVWAAAFVALIFITRAIQLKISKLPVMPLVFIAPRGLITVLLFLAIPAEQMIPIVNKSLIVQIILLSSLVMMAGVMLAKKDPVPET